MIRGSEERRRVISQSHVYHSVGKCRNIFLTSSALSPMELRSPSDVANLAFILGMSENQGKDAVSAKCWQLHKAAVGRRMGPFQVRVEKLDDKDCDDDDDESEEEGSDDNSDMELN